jgi:hypothetical protein
MARPAGSALLLARHKARTAHTTTTAATASQVPSLRLRGRRSGTAVTSSFAVTGGVDSSSPSLKNWVSIVLNAEDCRRSFDVAVRDSGGLVTVRKRSSEAIFKQPSCRYFWRGKPQRIRSPHVSQRHQGYQNCDIVVTLETVTPRFLRTGSPWGAVRFCLQSGHKAQTEICSAVG